MPCSDGIRRAAPTSRAAGRRGILLFLAPAALLAGLHGPGAQERQGLPGDRASAASDRSMAGSQGSEQEEAAAQARLMNLYEKMVQFNLDNEHTLSSAVIDSLMDEWAGLSLGAKIAAWADYFWKRGDAAYRFGEAEGGYAKEGRLIDDCHTDCVLFFYRATELGRSSSALEAVQFAFGTRFYGAILEEVVDSQGRVDYRTPVYLHYSEDMVRSGIWGRDITAELGPATLDHAGTARYPADSVSYVPKEDVRKDRMQDGDVIFFVADEKSDAGRRVRENGGMIGHIGIVKVEAGGPMIIHAAARPLEGYYAGGKVEKVSLDAYLARVENWKGIIATRIENF